LGFIAQGKKHLGPTQRYAVTNFHGGCEEEETPKLLAWKKEEKWKFRYDLYRYENGWKKNDTATEESEMSASFPRSQLYWQRGNKLKHIIPKDQGDKIYSK